MITRIREVRRARNMTLQDVADRCDPPTTPQTVGRLETGTRTVSMGWLNRIAAALGVDASDLVQLPEREDVPVAAMLGPNGAHALRRESVALPPRPAPGQVALLVEAGIGDYRAGDELWLDRLAPEHFTKAMNRDVLVPRPAGRYLFGRLIGRDAPAKGEGGKIQLLPLGAGSRQTVLADPPWLGLAVQLIRRL
jgi:transcriptional regulator with XRE-family HTH domain